MEMKKEKHWGVWWASEISQNISGCRLFYREEEGIKIIVEEMKEQGYRLVETKIQEKAKGLEFRQGSNFLLWVIAFVEIE